MKNIKSIAYIGVMALILNSCGNGTKKGNDALSEKKAELEKLKSEKSKTDDKVKSLEEDIAKLDTSAVNTAKVKLVSITPVQAGGFSHFVDLQGRIDATNTSYVTPRNGGGQVTAIFVKQGDAVKKGQLLLRLDNAIVKQNYAAAVQGQEGIKTQLTLAKDLLNRQNNLWKQGIGTEVQLLNAKTQVQSLENQLKTAQENAGVVREQVNTSNVYADISGVAEIVNVRVGEVFMGMVGSSPQIKLVNTAALKVVANVPENYLGKINPGSKVKIVFPNLQDSISAIVKVAGRTIDPSTRSFYIEAPIPTKPSYKPNQVALVKIQDYTASDAISAPLNTLQNDEKGKYIMIAVKDGDKLIARKKPVTIGELYGDLVEIKTGLQAGDQIVTEGFQNLYEGQLVSTK